MSTDWVMVTHAEASNPDDGSQILTQVGVLKTGTDGDDFVVTVGIADTPVITVADSTALRIAELLTEAVAERAIYVEEARQRNAAVLANQLGHAVLTQRQWSRLRDTASDQHAQRVLRAAAPESWTNGEGR